MTYPRPSSVTRLLIAFILLSLLVLRTWTIYVPLLESDGFELTNPLDIETVSLMSLFTLLLAGVIWRHRSTLTIEVSGELRKRPHLAVPIGIVLLAGGLLGGVLFWYTLVGLMEVINTLDVLAVTVIVMAVAVFTMAFMTAAGLYALIIVGLATIMGYLLLARALIGHSHPAIPLLASAIGGGLFIIPVVGLVVEAAVTAAAVGGSTMVLHRRMVRSTASADPLVTTTTDG